MSDRGGTARVAPRVAIIARRGKFLVAEPFFAPGARLAINRDKRFEVGDLVELSGARARAAAAARGDRGSCAGSGVPISRAT
jgi:hypothetical protein